MSIWIPHTPPSRAHPLREFLRSRDGQQFREAVVMTDAVSKAVQRVLAGQKLKNANVMQALLTTLVSAVQAIAPEEEWNDVAIILAEELRARLTIDQVN